MKKIVLISSFSLLLFLMAINISLVVKGPQVSLSNVVLHAIGETTEGEFDKLKCTEKYEDCFTGKGCRCWKSNLVVCSECKRDAYMCEKQMSKKIIVAGLNLPCKMMVFLQVTKKVVLKMLQFINDHKIKFIEL